MLLTAIVPWIRYLEERMGWAISHIWHLIGQDIENTLHDVGQKIINEPDLDDVVKHRRAEAMYELSKIFGVRHLSTLVVMCKINPQEIQDACHALLPGFKHL